MKAQDAIRILKRYRLDTDYADTLRVLVDSGDSLSAAIETLRYDAQQEARKRR